MVAKGNPKILFIMEKILKKYEKVLDKKGLCITLSQNTKVIWKTIYNHWLTNGGSVPEQHREYFIEEINRVLKMQSMEINQAIEL